MFAAMSAHTSSPPVAVVTRAARGWVVAAAFLGWLFAGVQMSMTSLVSLSATTDFVGQPAGDGAARKVAPSQVLTTWFARYNATCLFGAAAGGLLFGWFGDRFGRAKALGLSVCCYSLFSGVAGFAHTPEQFVLLRFLGCLGIGGTWPNGIALAAET